MLILVLRVLRFIFIYPKKVYFKFFITISLTNSNLKEKCVSTYCNNNLYLYFHGSSYMFFIFNEHLNYNSEFHKEKNILSPLIFNMFIFYIKIKLLNLCVVQTRIQRLVFKSVFGVRYKIL